MSLQFLKLSDITVKDRFRHDLGDIESLVESIKEKGVLQPITVDEEKNLLAGGRRYEAAKRAGLEEIPALMRSVDSRVDALEVELVENILRQDLTWQERARLVKRINELYKEANGGAEWGTQAMTGRALDKSKPWVSRQLQLADALDAVPEFEECKNEDEVFKQLRKAEDSIRVSTARQQQEEELAKFGLEGEEGDQDEDGPPTHRKPNYLKVAAANFHVSDTFDEMQDLAEMEGGAGRFDLLEIDPPYGIDLASQRKDASEMDFDTYNEIPAEEYPDFLFRLCDLAYKVCADDAWCLFWFGPTWVATVREALLAAGFKLDDMWGIWDKGAGQTGAPNLYLARTYEPFYIARKGQPQIRKKGRSNIFRYSGVPQIERYHQTQRPLPLMQEILSTFTYPNKRILVPFLGSGVTLRACYLEGMLGMGFDLANENRDRFLLAVQDDIEAGLYGGNDESS